MEAMLPLWMLGNFDKRSWTILTSWTFLCSWTYVSWTVHELFMNQKFMNFFNNFSSQFMNCSWTVHEWFMKVHEFINSVSPGVLRLKWGALSFKLSVMKKTHIWTPFNVQIYLDDALLFQNKENKILFGPPQKGPRIRMVTICQHAQVFFYTISPWPGYSIGRDWAVGVIRTTK